MLEAYSVKSMLEGMGDASYIHLAPRQGRLAQLLHGAASAVLRPVRRLVQRGSERLMRNAVEQEFDSREFLEGARGAVEEVMRRYGAQEWSELEGMVSEAMVEGMKAAHDDLLQRRRLKVQSISVDVEDASLQMTCVWGRRSVEHFDVARAGAQVTTGLVPFWNLAFVDVIGRVRVRLADAETGAAATNETSRQGVFVFARGPLPRQAVPDVLAPWWVVGWL
ncbi:MAG: hypothetical protein J3K34DRAFT_399893 [Monoraphidium minutum]|nr:MAG: hypothetical protein J3K34DRAFT_399893 [Monoraphidium minutum]